MTAPAISRGVLQTAIQHKIDNKTKPPGALGRLEELALQAGLIQGTDEPELRNPQIVVFAADHGIAATGLVNPYPQAVTAQMVLNFLGGGAAINVFSRMNGIGLTVVDAGVNFDFKTSIGAKDAPTLVDEKIGYGTRNYLEEPAMSREEAMRAIEAGRRIVRRLHEDGCNCIGFGEMGIGNTSSASLIMSFVTGIPADECCGRGTGANDDQMETKITTIRNVFRKHLPAVAASPDALTILSHVGGFEIAMMTGAYLQAAELRMIVLVDGFITTAALLTAVLIDNSVLECCIFSHTSGEAGHVKMLKYLGVEPLLELGMRLGEGTGAALAFPILRSAVGFLREMASFESAGVSRKAEEEPAV